MKKIDDSKLYYYFSIVTLALALIVGALSFYSIIFVEPEIKELLSAKNDISNNYKKAYIKLRDPQIFGLYENFDAEGSSVKNSLIYFDNKIFAGKDIVETEKKYLELLLDRRMKGARLGRNTMFFLLLLTFFGGGMYLYERKQS